MKRTTITALLAAIIAALALTGCATAQADAPEKPAAEFAYVHDWSEPKEPQGMVRIKNEMDEKAARAAESAPEAPIAEQVDSQPDYWDGTAYSGPYNPDLNNNPAYIGGGDGFAQQGVREFNGRTESWYSSNQAYHYRTAEWTADDEGYYRDGDGNYVVAASDMPEGTTFETSKGTAKVYDSGCENGVTDFYTAF